MRRVSADNLDKATLGQLGYHSLYEKFQPPRSQDYQSVSDLCKFLSFLESMG